MDLITLILLGIGLSMDAFAVSITNGMVYANYTKKNVFEAALAFGIFQGLMPIIGYFSGKTFASVIQSADHWIALILLGYIGGKMIYDAIHDNGFECIGCKIFSIKELIIQAIATSIDALAVGISFSLFDINIFSSASIICVITFVFCIIGAIIGRKVGEVIKSKSLFFGGLILIGIGLKIFIEHSFK